MKCIASVNGMEILGLDCVIDHSILYLRLHVRKMADKLEYRLRWCDYVLRKPNSYVRIQQMCFHATAGF